MMNTLLILNRYNIQSCGIVDVTVKPVHNGLPKLDKTRSL